MKRAFTLGGAVTLATGLVALALTGGTGDRPGAPDARAADAAEDAAPPEVDCATRIQVLGHVEPPGRPDLVIGQVGFVALKGVRRLSPRMFRPPRGAKWAPWKAPFIVPGRFSSVVISVSPADRAAVQVGFGRDQQPYEVWASSIEVRPCPATAKNPRTAFLGGFRLRRPKCVTLGVQVDGGPLLTRRVAFGRGTCKPR